MTVRKSIPTPMFLYGFVMIVLTKSKKKEKHRKINLTDYLITITIKVSENPRFESLV